MPEITKVAERGVPSLVWRAGQERRLAMIRAAGGDRLKGRVLVDGCGLGAYLVHLQEAAEQAVGLEIELDRCIEAHQNCTQVTCGAGESLPFVDDTYDFVLNHEVLEHVQNDQQVISEIVRVLKPGGRLVLFCPNRGYPYETHGIYWRGAYRFGNIPLVNYLPRRLRDKLAPHVRVYSRRDLDGLFSGLPVRMIKQTVIFGAYDNIIARFGFVGKVLRVILQTLERTPLKTLGLSHFWIVEKVAINQS